MTFKPSSTLIRKAQNMLSKGRYVQGIDLNIPDEIEFKRGFKRCRVMFIDTNTGETGCTYMKLNAQTKGVSDE